VGKVTSVSGLINYAYAIADSTTTYCYYLSGTGSGNTGSTVLTEAQMKMQSLYATFNFNNVWTINIDAVHPYPQLKDNVQDLSEMASLVSIVALPANTQSVIGKELDLAGGMVRVVYASGKEEVLNISAYMISGFDNSILGEQTVTVTVNGASDTFTVTVVDTPENRGVNEVRLLTKPTVTTYVVGSAFDFSGATVAVSYADGAYETVDVTEDMTSGGNINHIGKQTINVTVGDKSASFEVEVVGISFENIKLTTPPTKLTYLEGDALDLSGMIITAVMNNGTESSINSGYTVSGYSSTPGVHTVSVTYLEKTVSFEVTVTEKEIVSLKLEALPEKLEYISGEEFDRNGVNLTATYNNGDVEKVTDFTVSGFDDVPGIKTVVLSFEGKSVSFPVTVTSKVITDFNLVSAPSKLNYIEGEEFDSTGLVAEVTYNNGTRELVEDYEIIGFTSTPGVHTVAVTYSGFVQNFVITVSEKVLDDVVVTPPAKLNYYIGEEFDATGLTVTACYNNGVRQGVDGYTISGFDSKTAGIKTVTVSYGGFTRSFALSVTKKTPVQSNGSVKVDSVKGRLGETVEVDVALTQNPGLAGFCHTISFDVSAVKFVSAKLKGAFANGTIVVNEENKASGEISIVWFQAEDVTEAGVAYTLSFEILETAEDGVSEISVSFDLNDNGNAEGQDVEFGTVNGSVEVLSYWLGDLDGNREFTMADLLQLAQYVSGMDITLSDNQLLSADVNEDTFIDIHDVTLLSQWLLNADI